LKVRAAGVGDAVGTGTVVASGVATVNGTLTKGRGCPGKTGTEGCVSGGGPGGAAGAWARVTAPDPAMTSPNAAADAKRAALRLSQNLHAIRLTAPGATAAEKVRIYTLGSTTRYERHAQRWRAGGAVEVPLHGKDERSVISLTP
jgi:hypothetical protein